MLDQALEPYFLSRVARVSGRVHAFLLMGDQKVA